MIDYLPPWMRGLLVAAFAAAFMSAIGTNLNWGASYLVNDFYRRFGHKDASEKHYVSMAQVASVFLTIVAAIMTYYMDSIAGAWKLLIVTGAGTGTVLILRWYWWRINAWSEVSAMIAAFVVSFTLQLGFGLNSDDPYGFAYIMLITVGITTVVWLSVTFLTAPEPMDTLVAFYRKVHPWTAGWAAVEESPGNSAHARHGVQSARLDRRVRDDLRFAFRRWQAAAQGIRDRSRIPSRRFGRRRGHLPRPVAPRLEFGPRIALH